MDFGIGVLRHWIMAWRDRQIIGGYELLNSTAIAVRNAFEKQLQEATFLDAAWHPAGFANHRIDALFCSLLRGPLDEFFRSAGTELAALDDRLSEIGSILAEGGLVELPVTQDPGDGSAPVPTSEASASHGEDMTLLARVGGALASGAGSISSYASNTADWLVQDKIGLRNRLRHAAAARIATTWMGDIGEPPPVLSQVVRAIEVATDEARIKTW